MRILIVANSEKSGLSQQYPELARIADRNIPRILDGPVTIQLLETTLDHEQFEAIHFIGHGTNRLLQMADGLLTIDWLIRRLKNQAKLELVFFNSCDSVEMAAEVHTKLQIVCIAQRPSVRDDFGAIFAINFYGAITRGASYNEAFYEARATVTDLYPSELHPLLLNGIGMDQPQFQAETVAALKVVQTQLTDVNTAIQRFNTFGSPALRQLRWVTLGGFLVGGTLWAATLYFLLLHVIR